MAYEPAELAQMIAERTLHEDSTLAAVEAVLLRSAIERLDDFLLWLDQDTHETHAEDAVAVGRTIGAVHHRIALEIRIVDAALERIEE